MMDGSEPSDFSKDRAELFEALGHRTRIQILQALTDGALSFTQLRWKVGISSNGLLSFHLGKLDGLIRMTQDGSYAITDEGREALRVVSTAWVAEDGRSVFRAKGNGSGEEVSLKPSEGAYHRRKKTIVALAAISSLLVIGAAISYQVLFAAGVFVYVDFTLPGSRMAFSIYNRSSYVLGHVEIWVNESLWVDDTSSFYPGVTSYGHDLLPSGLVAASGNTYNITVAVYYRNGDVLIKQTTLRGLSDTTLSFYV